MGSALRLTGIPDVVNDVIVGDVVSFLNPIDGQASAKAFLARNPVSAGDWQYCWLRDREYVVGDWNAFMEMIQDIGL